MADQTSAILGIESSCDETSAAIVTDGTVIRGTVVASQEELHRRFGGVIPEIACRAHVQAILPTVQEAFDRSGLDRADITAVAVASEPGLVGSLLIGLTFAKAFALAFDLPLIGVNHLQAHIYAALLENTVAFPAVSLVVSGGHTALFLSRGVRDHELLGSTIDDAAGEAFDKVASILGLGYPGGPIIDRLAREGDPRRFRFPRTFIRDDHLKFSFSGLKTAVLYHCQGHSAGRTPIRAIDEQEKRDIAAGFQEAVVDVIIAKVARAVAMTGARSVLAGGGVICNSRLRTRLQADCPVPVFIPAPRYCIDNAAMVAGLGYHHFLAGAVDDLNLDVNARPLRMAGKQ